MSSNDESVMPGETEASEQRPKERAQAYGMLLDSAPLPLFLVDPETRRYLYVNRAAEETYGYSAREFVEQMTLADLRSDEDDRALRAAVADPVPRGTTRRFGIWTHETKDGRELRMDVSVHAVEHEGRPAYVVAATDVTQRLEHEEAIRRSESLLRETGASARVGGYALELDTRAFHCTEQVWEIFEIEPIDGDPWDRIEPLIDPDYRESVSKARRGALDSGGTIDIEVPIVTPLGRGKWVRFRAQPQYVNGRMTRIHGTVQDTTDRKAAEAALSKSERRYRALTDQAPLAIVAHVEGRLRYVNRRAVALLGATSAAELRGVRQLDLVHPDDRASAAARFRSILEDGLALTEAVERWLRADGSVIHVETTDTPISFGGESGIQSVVRDVTAERRSERELARRDRILAGVSLAARDLLTAASFDQGIARVLEALGRAAEASRAYIFESHRDADGIEVVSQRASWEAPGIQAVPRSELQGIPWSSGFERWRRLLQAGKTVVGLLEEFPEDERAFLEPQGIRALAVVPIMSTDTLWGFVGFDDCVEGRAWSHTEMEALGAAAGVVEAVLQRDGTLHELRRSQERLLNAERIARIGNWEWDLRSDEVVWSDGLYRVWGLEPRPGGVSYEQYLDRVHPDDREHINSVVREAYEHGGDFAIQHRIERADGIRHIQGLGRVELEDGIPARMLGIAQDITERVESEASLRRLHDQLQTIAENIPGAVYRRVVHPDGTVRYPYSNGSIFRRFQVGSEDLAADPTVLFSRVHEEDRPTFMRLASQCGEGSQEYTFRVIDASGDVRWIRSLSTGRAMLDGTFVRDGIVLDITDQKQLEHQLRQSQKLEAVGLLTGGIAHDFNNLLSIILTNVELLRLAREGADHDPELEILDDVLGAARSGADLVKGLLGFSRRADLTFQAVDLEAKVGEAAKLLGRVMPATVDFQVEFGEDVGTVVADPGALQQIIMNLVTNARDALPDGGTVRVRVDSLDIHELPRGVEHLAKPGCFKVISVADNGSGMDEETLAQVFDPFFTTKRPGQGTGLGLGVVHGLVSQHGGFTTVESLLGVGTTFRVHLPATTEPTLEERSDHRRSEIRPGRETVLLVDDEPAVRRAARASLEHLGYKVVEAGDGAEAVELLEHRSDVELIVTDVVMPEMGGAALYDRVTSFAPEIPFLFVSGHMAGDLNDRGGVPEGVTFLAKPYALHELAKKVDESLAARRGFGTARRASDEAGRAGSARGNAP